MDEMERIRKASTPTALDLSIVVVKDPKFQLASSRVTNPSERADLQIGVRGIVNAADETERKKAVGTVLQISEKYNVDPKLRAHLTSDLAAASSARAEAIRAGNITQANQLATMYLQGATANQIITKMDDWGYTSFADQERARQATYQTMFTELMGRHTAQMDIRRLEQAAVPTAIKSVQQYLIDEDRMKKEEEKRRRNEDARKEGEAEARKEKSKGNKNDIDDLISEILKNSGRFGNIDAIIATKAFQDIFAANREEQLDPILNNLRRYNSLRSEELGNFSTLINTSDRTINLHNFSPSVQVAILTAYNESLIQYHDTHSAKKKA